MAERKKFIDVEIPILNKSVQVLGTPTDVIGKTIKLDISRKLRGKGVIITLEVINHEEKIVAMPKRIEIIKSYLRKIIRKRTDIVEDSFLANCSDIRATIKPFLITRKKVSRVVRKNLRNTAREFLMSYVKDKTYYEISNEILDGTIQREMLPKLKKVYPLAFCDIRIFETKDLEKLDLSKALLIKSEDENEEDKEVELSEDEENNEVEKTQDQESEVEESEEKDKESKKDAIKE